MRLVVVALLVITFAGCAPVPVQSAPPVVQRISMGLAMSPTSNVYLDQVRRHIASRWGYPCVLNSATGECEYKDASVALEFGIAKNGEVPMIRVLRPSGYPTYDQHAIDTVRAAAPFPPIPESFSTKDVALTITLKYTLDRRERRSPRRRNVKRAADGDGRAG